MQTWLQKASGKMSSHAPHNARALSCRNEKPIRRLWANVKRDRAYLIMCAIPIAYFIIFKYIPMLGLNIAFREYYIGDSIFNIFEKFVGFKWFEKFFSSPFAWRVIKNTIILSSGVLLVLFPLPILLALLFNEVRNATFRGAAQTISYMPHFLSVAIVVGIMTNMFSVNGGIVNDLLNRFGVESIDFMQSARWFRTMYIGSSLWMQIGFNSILFSAAIAGVDQELYEAARIDGSTRFKNIIYITLPSISPTIITVLILRLGQIMSIGYEKVLLMYAPVNYSVSDIISTYVYRTGIVDGLFSYASAVDLFNSCVNVCMLLLANYLNKKLFESSIF